MRLNFNPIAVLAMCAALLSADWWCTHANATESQKQRSSNSTRYSSSVRLSDLPDQAVLVVPRHIPLQIDSWDDSHVYFHTHFDNREIDLSTDASSWSQYLDSGVTLQTTSIEPIGSKIVSGVLFDDWADYLINGEYCLNQRLSKFKSPTKAILSFHDCRNGSFQFNVYVQAGWTLRNSAGFQELTLRDFQDQVGKWLYFRK